MSNENIKENEWILDDLNSIDLSTWTPTEISQRTAEALRVLQAEVERLLALPVRK